ncbi:similar to Saccharomyces cerevisiae YLR088W GAA1 Subunit of the GPI (glycosylphosphatidylinositol):protein transamidase complex [Maudiozyma barnettii]|uniref:Similar to Saccharomyces cerevisiae YLR088W GAA1 Subunit of the GPI (Glycosylphosphatidylinositol):protein transamidase complex n=1 Tax=Maudiozyma barnettii TaxID=61262 RepID=A0A8H2VHR6_9SACH|nr:GPI-anchor transamidase subunit GAA1 [Kazachstania barnettii]CAB4255702.1 similar to Saccharomyces cerevisiae YLR088W GAA1 Subunit of the GPI (glycosylphosphatidylinositol):protein transamidase complex [Kazachstania barnettii]CAD1784263.1 similar to Saccharomyces cerevisiae YLR088W GAA1 Subunit of the GPI (glycosylphosphatidylinositol):protein transamidase complex [Kazachstania barnettii]
MGLLTNLHRKVIVLGLVPKFLKQLPQVAKLLMLISLIMIAIIPMDGQYRRTYISENALMPSQAYSYFRESEWNIVRGYRSQIEEFVKNNATAKERNLEVESWLQDFGIKTSIYHNEEHQDTLYGILHTPRGDGTEAIVLSIPWYNGDDEFNVGGAALGIGLLRYFSRWPVWSKNLIIVFSENPRDSLRAWVEAYHTSLDLTGGSIEAAINIDYASDSDFLDYVEIYYDGLNGELPNLDLLNVAIKITQHEGMKVSLNGQPKDTIDDDGYFPRLKTMLLGIRDSTFAGVKRVHGNEAFSGWRIQAVTLKACGTEGNIDITSFGRVSEGIFRAVNNLLEKFHQSFFFYLILAPRNFVSISSYLPSAVIISVVYATFSLDALVNTPFGPPMFFNKESLLSLMILSITLASSYFLSQLFIYAPNPGLLIGLNILLTIVPYFIRKPVSFFKEPLTYRIRVFGYLYMSLVLTSLLVINFPLAFMMGILSFPMTLVQTQQSRYIANMSIAIKNMLYLTLSNPFFAILIVSNVIDSDLKYLDVFYDLILAWNDLSCWTWFLICIGWFPAWLLIAMSTIKSSQVTSVEDEKKQQ